MRFAPGLAALFESCVVQQPLTFQDCFEPTILLTLGPQPLLVSQEHANGPYAAAPEHIVNISGRIGNSQIQTETLPFLVICALWVLKAARIRAPTHPWRLVAD